MKKLVVVGSFLCALGAGAAETWHFDFAAAGDCSTPATAAAWNDVTCWTNKSGAHPSVAPGAGDTVSIRAKAAQAGVVYVRIDNDVTISRLVGDEGSLTGQHRAVVFGDYTLKTDGASDFCGHIVLFCRFSGNNVNDVGGYLNTTTFCGDLDPKLYGVLNSASLTYRMDRYATSAGETRVYAGLTDFNGSYGGYNVYTPVSSAEPVTGTWKLTAGSPFATRVSAAAHVLSAGTLVADAAGLLPEGTFLKRIFDDGTIELSAAVPAEAAGDVELTFAAFEPHVTGYIRSFVRRNTEWAYYGLNLYASSAADDVRLTLDYLGPHNPKGKLARYGFDGPATPGTLVLTNGWDSNADIRLGNCHFEFANPDPAKGQAGFPNANYMLVFANTTAELTSPAGVNAVITNVSEIQGTLLKTGAGTLTLTLPGAASAYPGLIKVDAGELALREGSTLPKIDVAAGATLRVEGECAAAGLTFAPGSTLAGGTVVVDDLADVPTGISFIDGGNVRIRGGSGEVLRTLPEAGVVGDPAFWVDFSTDEHVEFQDEEKKTVKLIKDVRGGADEGYMTAAPQGAYFPTLRAATRSGLAANALEIPTGKQRVHADISETYAPLWSKPLTNIRTVFVVVYAYLYTYSGGQFLGWQTGNGDFMRPADERWCDRIFYPDTCPAKIKNGRFYMNGVQIDPTKTGYPYEDQNNCASPAVAELHALDNCSADSFAYNAGQARDGCQRLAECIVYTNELTEAETLAVRRYLTRKWVGCDPHWTKGATKNGFGTLTGTASLGAAAGETVYVQKSSAASLEKYGDGEMVVEDLVCPAGTVHVAGGTLTVNSDALTIDSLPGGALLHVDASATNTLTKVEDGETTYVTDWIDVRAGSGQKGTVNSVSTNRPVLTTSAALGGRPVVDFGPWKHKESDMQKNISSMYLRKTYKYCHTILGIFGTANGGGQIAGTFANSNGDDSGYNSGWGIRRGGNWGQAAGDPLVSTSITGPIKNKLASEAFLNDLPIVACEDGFTGGWDTLSYKSWVAFGLAGLGSSHYNFYSGGQALAEYICYSNGLSNVDCERVAAYLDKKWRGTSKDGYREAQVGTLTVDAGATLNVAGDGALTVARISGGGTVNGRVRLTAGAVLEVVIRNDGSVAALTVGDVDLSKGGTVRLVGSVKTLRKGTQDLVLSSTISAGAADGWTLVYDGEARAVLTLKAVAGKLQLDKTPFGMMLLVR